MNGYVNEDTYFASLIVDNYARIYFFKMACIKRAAEDYEIAGAELRSFCLSDPETLRLLRADQINKSQVDWDDICNPNVRLEQSKLENTSDEDLAVGIFHASLAEAEEISDEDLEAAAEFYDTLTE